tara:strand:- start:33 stop:269 length:237 start_codon:yes stop_codon:yes gene_type:complete
MNIKLKSDLDHLERLAAEYHNDGCSETAIDIRRAVMDIANLRDHIWAVEKEHKQMAFTINRIKSLCGWGNIHNLEVGP